MFKNAKVLVTGGVGFVGINLINRLLDEGANISATLYQNNPVIKDDRIEYIRGDLRLEEECEKVVDGMDYVFMCAANTSGAKVMATNPLVHLTPNMLYEYTDVTGSIWYWCKEISLYQHQYSLPFNRFCSKRD